MTTETAAPRSRRRRDQRKWKESRIQSICRAQWPGQPRTGAQYSRVSYPRPKLPTGKLEEPACTGPNGPITVEIVQPVEGAPIGTLVYFHGGGYILGDIDSHQAHAIRFANRFARRRRQRRLPAGARTTFPAGRRGAIAGAMGRTPTSPGSAARASRWRSAATAPANFAARDRHQVQRAGIRLAARCCSMARSMCARTGILDIREPYFGSGDVEAKLNESAHRRSLRISKVSRRRSWVWPVRLPLRAEREISRCLEGRGRGLLGLVLGDGGVHVDVLLAGEPLDLGHDLVGDRPQDVAVVLHALVAREVQGRAEPHDRPGEACRTSGRAGPRRGCRRRPPG